MIKVLFVCHGNICRSPMAEFIFKSMVRDLKIEDQFEIESRATSTEEIGNPIYPQARKILDNYNIDYSKKRAKQITINDYNNFDYILVMDSNNLFNIKYIIKDDKENKIKTLLSYANIKRDISDPWYTRDFKKTESDIKLGLDGFINYLRDLKILNN